jgi:hypothetical protein
MVRQPKISSSEYLLKSAFHFVPETVLVSIAHEFKSTTKARIPDKHALAADTWLGDSRNIAHEVKPGKIVICSLFG